MTHYSYIVDNIHNKFCWANNYLKRDTKVRSLFSIIYFCICTRIIVMKNVVVLITINQILAYSDNKHNAVGHNCNKKA